MNKFGEIKSKLEYILFNNYGKDSFKESMRGFKKHILDNKSLSEAYFLYDQLSSKRGLTEEVAEEYLSSSIEQLKTIVQKEEKNIEKLNDWVNESVKTKIKNEYTDIDFQVYTKNVVKNLEKLIESSLRIKKLISDKNTVKETKIMNIPLSSMIKIATNTYNKNFSNISESEKSILNQYLSLTNADLKKQISESKQNVIDKLKSSLNESSDKELNEKIQKTIKKINDSKISALTLYKIKELEKGL